MPVRSSLPRKPQVNFHDKGPVKSGPRHRDALPYMNAQERERWVVEFARKHTEAVPHWSETVEWRDGRWDPMSNAPMDGKILHVRGRDAKGRLIENMHYAYGGGEEQPPFRGWFVPAGRYSFAQVDPVEWQPMRAKPHAPPELKLVQSKED